MDKTVLRTMHLSRLIAAGLLGLALAAPACAQSKDPRAELDARLQQIDPRLWLGGTVSEADAALLFAWLRASLLAAAQDRQLPPVPEELKQRADALARELRIQGALTGLALLDALEEYTRRALRERPTHRLPGAI